jgi:hypothetical protein
MALQKSHSVKGITCAESYWKVSQTNLDHLNKSGQVTFNCYFNLASRTASPTGNVIDQKSYVVDEALYTTYFAVEEDVRAQSYLLAKAHSDEFFATATDV